jgi:pilus assembly protein Flp/PilA
MDEQRDSGASAVEYGIIVGGIAALIILIVFSFGRVMQTSYADSCDTIAGKIDATDCPGN